MDTSANLLLPYIMPQQAQKFITHNEAVRALDALVMLAISTEALAAPPAAPVEGSRYIVAADATGIWTGKVGTIAAFQDGAWSFFAPREGWLAWCADEGRLLVWTGGAWQPAQVLQDLPMLGVNATADSTNRLAVAAAGSLFTHVGHDHRLAINKQSSADDASLILQDNFSGRAEIGLAGDDNLAIRVSPDGTNFQTAVSVSKDDGRLSVNSPYFSASTINLKGKALTGSGDGYFCITVTNTNTDLASKGGAVMTGAQFANANAPFMIIGPWSTGTSNTVYYGGGGWGTPDATEHRFYAGPYNPSATNTGTAALTINNNVISAGRPTVPVTDNTYSLGNSTLRWSVVYSNTGTISTSDERLKKVEGKVPLGLAFVCDLDPVAYRWKVGGHDVEARQQDAPADRPDVGRVTVDVAVPRPGTRTHYGLLAQQVKATLDAYGVADFAGWTLADKTDPASEQGLRYDQFVPILIKAVQELAAEVAALRQAG